MAKLRFSGNVEHTLDPKVATILGSGSEATVRLDDPSVSDAHCVVRALQGGGFGLKDLGSDGGTFVNGKRIEAVRLSAGAQIRIGAIDCEFDDGTVAAAPPPAATREPAAKPTPSKADADLSPGARLGGYEIEAVLGHGGMGTVYQGTQLSLGRQVAIKVLKAELAADPSFVERFVSEARAAGRFNHPNVVQVFDVDEEGGRPFYSMELLPDGSLEDRLKARGPMTIDEALQSLHDAARGLAYADELGLVHRDIKPDNLMPSSQGRLKICDLGLATDPGGGGKGKILGTPHFLSPEQARGRPVDHRSDVYSLGCSVYRLLTGKNPYPRKTVREILKAHLDAPVPSVKSARSECPDEVDALLVRMMAKDPDARPSAQDIDGEVTAMLEGASASKGPMLAIIGILVALIAGGLIWILTQDNKPVTIVRENPEAKKALAGKAENEAEIARLSVRSDLPLLERASALEAVAKKHAGTKAAELATNEANTLRKRAADAKAEADRVAAALKARIERVEGIGSRAADDPVASWKELAKLAGAAEPGSAFAKAIETAQGRVAEAWTTRATSAYERFEQKIADANADLEAAIGTLEKELASPADGDAPATIPAMLLAKIEAGRSRVESLRGERVAARRARIGELAKGRDAILFGDSGVLDLIRKGELDAAEAKLLGIPSAPEGLKDLDVPLEKLRRMFKDAKAALGDLRQRARADAIPLRLRGAAVRLKDVNGVRGTVVARDGSEIQVVLTDEPALTAQLLAVEKAFDRGAFDASKRKHVALFLLVALADASPSARSYLASFGAQTSTPQFPWALQSGLAALQQNLPADDELRIEAEGLDCLGRMMHAIQQKSEIAAAHWAAQLEKKAASSLIGQSLGIEGGS